MYDFKCQEIGRKPGADGKHINLRLSPVQARQLDDIADRAGITKSDVLRALLTRYVCASAQEGSTDNV